MLCTVFAQGLCTARTINENFVSLIFKCFYYFNGGLNGIAKMIMPLKAIVLGYHTVKIKSIRLRFFFHG